MRGKVAPFALVFNRNTMFGMRLVVVIHRRRQSTEAAQARRQRVDALLCGSTRGCGRPRRRRELPVQNDANLVGFLNDARSACGRWTAAKAVWT